MRIRLGIVAGLLLVLCAGAVLAGPTYIGAAKCKMCHKAQFSSWEATPHANAFAQLEGDDKANADCLKCHATNSSADMANVQCEACHGPGSDYKSMKVMKDHDASIAAGLVIPDEGTCLGCHKGAPHDQAAFNYEEAKATGLHEMKAE